MIEAMATRVIDKLIAMQREIGTPEGSIMNEMHRDILADLVRESLSGAGMIRRRNPADRDRR
jgi:hypothetical protein